MKQFFDTSVLVAAAIGTHADHDASLAAILRSGPRATAAHCLAEMYNTLTRLSGPYRLSASEALLSVESAQRQWEIVTLSARDHGQALRRAASLGIVGPVIYDFLIACAAERAAADRLYTWNVRHFAAFGPSLRLKISAPPASVQAQ